MFIWAGVSRAGNIGRGICGAICCFVLGGPILVIVGIVLLAAKNTRSADVDTYNSAVAAYNGSAVRSWSPGSTYLVDGSMDGGLVTVNSSPVYVEGNRDGIDAATSIVLERNLDAKSSTYPTRNVNFSLTGVTYFQRSFPAATVRSSSIGCDTNKKKGNCNSMMMQSRCEALYGNAATYEPPYTGASCSGSSGLGCGECKYTTYLEGICVVVSSKAPYTLDPILSSCYYPFDSSPDSQKYSQKYKSTSFTVSIRKADDPFIVLQRLTKGSNNFGLTAAQQRGIGFACISIGIILLLASAGAGYGLYLLIKRATAGGGLLGQTMQPSLVAPSYQPYQQPEQGYPVQQYPMHTYQPNSAYCPPQPCQPQGYSPYSPQPGYPAASVPQQPYTPPHQYGQPPYQPSPMPPYAPQNDQELGKYCNSVL